jgi:hypothetical protein
MNIPRHKKRETQVIDAVMIIIVRLTDLIESSECLFNERFVDGN